MMCHIDNTTRHSITKLFELKRKLLSLSSVIHIRILPSFTCQSDSGCSKLTMSLVKVSLKFQMLISEICQ